MKMQKLKVLLSAGALAGLAGMQPAWALDNNSIRSIDVRLVSAAAQCSDYSTDPNVREVTFTQFGPSTIVQSGPDNPLDPGNPVSIALDIEYRFGFPALGPVKITSLTSSTRINAVILHGNSNFTPDLANMFIEPPGGVTQDGNFALNFVNIPFEKVTVCYGDSFASQQDDPLPLCETAGVDLGECDPGDAFECEIDLASGKLSCCACTEEFANPCIPGLPLEQGGCGIIQLEDFQSIDILKGSSCICYPTNVGLRCFGSCF